MFRRKGDPYYSSMPYAMLTVLCLSAAGCGTLFWLHARTGAAWAESTAITCLTVAYHMAMRFAVPGLVWLIFRRRYHPEGWWFRQKAWEPELYCRLGVQRWKAGMMTFNPAQFSMREFSLRQIVMNMCHAEVVHEVIMLLSVASVGFTAFFGSFWVFLLTGIGAAAFDGVFVVMQRYNRPRIAALADRREARGRAKTKEEQA